MYRLRCGSVFSTGFHKLRKLHQLHCGQILFGRFRMHRLRRWNLFICWEGAMHRLRCGSVLHRRHKTLHNMLPRPVQWGGSVNVSCLRTRDVREEQQLHQLLGRHVSVRDRADRVQNMPCRLVQSRHRLFTVLCMSRRPLLAPGVPHVLRLPSREFFQQQVIRLHLVPRRLVQFRHRVPRVPGMSGRALLTSTRPRVLRLPAGHLRNTECVVLLRRLPGWKVCSDLGAPHSLRRVSRRPLHARDRCHRLHRLSHRHLHYR